MSNLMTIGQVTRAHGFKGEFKVFPLTDDIRRFRKLRYIIINDVEYKISFVKLQSDRAILKVEGIDSDEAVDKIKSLYIQVREEDAVKKKKDEYFIEELKGIEVYDEANEYLGKIYDVIQTGSNDVYWIKDGKELLIPALKTIIRDVDINNNKMIIVSPKVWNYQDDEKIEVDENDVENYFNSVDGKADEN